MPMLPLGDVDTSRLFLAISFPAPQTSPHHPPAARFDGSGNPTWANYTFSS